MNDYDIIGDIHGHCDELEQLLIKLGYQKEMGIYKHSQGRMVLYVGDFIDRGPKIRETLNVVKNMVDAGSALAVMGNHEYNAVCFHTMKKNGGFFRKHGLKEIEQHIDTLKQFENFRKEWDEYMNWFKHLPMFLELDNCKVVHAYWNDDHIHWLKNNYHPELEGLDETFLYKVADKETLEGKVIEETLKGPEQDLPDGSFFIDKGGAKRTNCRIKWWATSYETMEEGLMDCPKKHLKDPMPIKLKVFNSDKPVFFGHYWLKGEPETENKSAICLDYSVAKGGILVAAQWDGQQLNFVH